MKVLVTGGAGFIGSHLCEALLAEGLEVISIDNLATGRRANLRQLENRPRFRFHHLDVTRQGVLSEVMEGVDWVFHLAGLADIVPSIEQPDVYFHTNVQGTLATLEAARNAGVNRFIYAASASCYGIPETYPTPEHAPIQPRYPYALTKRLGEELVLHWNEVYGMQALSLRLFNVYGPRSRTTGAYGAVFGVFLAQKYNGKPFTVVGDGNQTRDFTFVSDVVAAFLASARSKLSGLCLNVGSGGSYSINHLVELLEGPVTHVPKRPGEPEQTFADITAIRNLLDWQPRVSLEEGVAIMLEHIEDWEDAPVWESETIAEATASWFKHLGEGT